VCVFPEKACCKHNIKPSPKEPEPEFQGVSERIERIDARRNAALANRYGYMDILSRNGQYERKSFVFWLRIEKKANRTVMQHSLDHREFAADAPV